VKPILVVAGVRAHRRRLAEVLAHAGYSVIKAQTGESALKLAQDIPPGLALIAIVMPDINGLEIAAQLHQSLGNESPPIILLGAIRPIGLEEEPLASLVSGYLNIDVSSSELLATVRSQLVMSSQ
jgi:CheY-like chemotaxis protein